MKTYQTNNERRKKNFFMRHMKAIVISFSALVVATAITLAVVFSLPNSAPVGGNVTPPDNNEPDTTPSVVLPVEGAQIGQGYAKTSLVYWATLKQWRTHEGIDFIAPAGTKIVAVTDGTVLKVQDTDLEGCVVTISHENGYVSVYKGVGDTAVTEGQVVKSGDKIGTVTNNLMTEESTGAHLHFALTKDNNTVDPATLLPLSDDNK